MASVSSDLWNVTGIDLVRQYDPSSPTVTLRNLADFLGTIIYDYVAGWDGSLYTVTTADETSIDISVGTRSQLGEVLVTLVALSPSDELNTTLITRLNAVALYSANCDSATLRQLLRLFAGLCSASVPTGEIGAEKASACNAGAAWGDSWAAGAAAASAFLSGGEIGDSYLAGAFASRGEPAGAAMAAAN